MEPAELTKVVNHHDAILSKLEEWQQNINRRLDAVEGSSSVVTDLKMLLLELKMSNTNFAEKLNDLKVSLEKINNDNQLQHVELQAQLKDLQLEPGVKWNKMSWFLITAVIGGIAGYVIKLLLG